MERCPQCSVDVTAIPQAKHTTCPHCGAALPPTVVKPSPGPPPLLPSPSPPTGGERAMLRVCFWLLLISPPLAIAALVAKPGSTLDVLPVALKSVMKQVMPLPAQIIAIA